MLKSLGIFDFLPFIQHLHIFSFDKVGVNGAINALFWSCITFFVIYHYFSKLLLVAIYIYETLLTILFIPQLNNFILDFAEVAQDKTI